jgi:hypothetical protein
VALAVNLEPNRCFASDPREQCALLRQTSQPWMAAPGLPQAFIACLSKARLDWHARACARCLTESSGNGGSGGGGGDLAESSGNGGSGSSGGPARGARPLLVASCARFTAHMFYVGVSTHDYGVADVASCVGASDFVTTGAAGAAGAPCMCPALLLQLAHMWALCLLLQHCIRPVGQQVHRKRVAHSTEHSVDASALYWMLPAAAGIPSPPSVGSPGAQTPAPWLILSPLATCSMRLGGRPSRRPGVRHLHCRSHDRAGSALVCPVLPGRCHHAPRMQVRGWEGTGSAFKRVLQQQSSSHPAVGQSA